MTASPSPSVDPVRERIAEQVKKIKSEFDLGGYFSDPSHTRTAEGLLDTLAAALRAVLDLHQPYVSRMFAGEVTCNECANREWPCATFRAIAAGLGVTP